MSLLNDLLGYNEQFVNNKEYEQYVTTKSPDKKLVLISCMDTRLTELSTKALGLKNGDIKHIQNAGAVISHPYGSTMRSILVAVYMLGADEVMVMGHHDCGFGALKPEPMMNNMMERGIKEETFETLKHSGIDVTSWLKGFDSVEESITESVGKIKHHPLMVEGVPIHGTVINPENGKVDLVVNGYES
ncbi:carbonic anhydrase [Salinicoccus cyprini]|uniref:carbonic anhydrase n=1 Tax=Salinicoccus cyprini TaxID=2493691 RepID=A0A558ATN0_9STAP|nr:carbonic anhydrase [Salinicoccus cyprini]TVT27623.1 carbonic anhydrase [Salinicoccus cyprini]